MSTLAVDDDLDMRRKLTLVLLVWGEGVVGDCFFDEVVLLELVLRGAVPEREW